MPFPPKDSLNQLIALAILCCIASLSGCTNGSISVDTDTPDALVWVGSDGGIDGDPQRPVPELDYDSGLPDDEPDPDEEQGCEETSLLPPGLRGDIVYATANPGDVVRLSMGHDTRRNELLQTCTQGEVAIAGGQDAEFEVRELETREQISESLKVDAAISAGFMGFSFTNRFEMARSSEVSMYDLNIWLHVRVQTRSEALVNDVQLKPQYAELLQDDPFGFLTRCGDRFVQQVTYGGELLVILSIKTTSETDRRELSNRLSASFGPWGSANVNIEETFLREFENREVNILIDRRGGNGALPVPRNAEDLFAYAQNFPVEVAENEPVVFEYVTRPYDRIASDSICLPGFDQKSIQIIETAWTRLNEAVGIRNAIKDALETPSAYACGSNQERREDLAKLNLFLDQLDDLAERCAREMATVSASPQTGMACRALEQLLQEYEAPSTPLRWQEIKTFNTNAKRRYQTFNISESLVCDDPIIEGIWSPWSSNNRCPNAERCWQPCPIGARTGVEYEIEFPDAQPSDNRGNCSYTFHCLNAQDAYLLDECDDEE